ncbi:MAG TPA: SDR family NAD(P)-dependent oxidoreductase [Acidobacteriaceae bacterium]|nr:SDR family NAD(P)-dependent oxidoreductase [Acidobacteriaceae bacterium]
MDSLKGKRVLVTGGARRIGRGLAMALGRAGADVAITYRTSVDEAEHVLLDLNGIGVRTLAVACDVHHEWSVERAIDDAATALGGLDILINNAGRFETEALERITIEQWDEMFATNTRGPFLVARHAFRHLKRAHGRIINIGSLGGIHPWSTHAHYSTSKAALHMLSQTMAKAWAPDISVNCVAPGMIVTGGEISAGYEHFAEKTPMKRNGTIEDVAAAVLFFATGPHFITGQILAVDGGLGL